MTYQEQEEMCKRKIKFFKAKADLYEKRAEIARKRQKSYELFLISLLTP